MCSSGQDIPRDDDLLDRLLAQFSCSAEFRAAFRLMVPAFSDRLRAVVSRNLEVWDEVEATLRRVQRTKADATGDRCALELACNFLRRRG
jgi:hypothetical protein